MLHPVGSLPASVYWRRRLMLLAAVLILAGLTAWELRPGGNPTPRATAGQGERSSPSNAALTSTPPLSTPTVPKASTSHTAVRPSGAVAACTLTQLRVSAVVGQPAYRVGQDPDLMLQVTNTGPSPCVQNLADSQIVLEVYNGQSRVWGSHDCQIQPGTEDRTLVVGQPVRVSIVWSGLSSQPSCAGTRQPVGAGTYTLYAVLSGHTGTAAQFAIS